MKPNSRAGDSLLSRRYSGSTRREASVCIIGHSWNCAPGSDPTNATRKTSVRTSSERFTAWNCVAVYGYHTFVSTEGDRIRSGCISHRKGSWCVRPFTFFRCACLCAQKEILDAVDLALQVAGCPTLVAPRLERQGGDVDFGRITREVKIPTREGRATGRCA